MKLFGYEEVPLSGEEILKLSRVAEDYANTHGIVMRNQQNNRLTNIAPFMLFPTPFPKYLYEEAFKVQKDFQTLMHLASLDHDFLQNSLNSVMVHDEFIRRHFEIYEQVRKENVKPKYFFNVIRSDYMINELTPQTNGHTNTKHHSTDVDRPYELKQIEVNVIAASFGGLDTKVGDLHRYMADVMGEKSPYNKNQLADNSALYKLGEGLSKIWQLYGKTDAVIVFVVMDGESNSLDQRHLEYSFHDSTRNLGTKKHVPVLFRTLGQIYNNGNVKEDGTLVVEGFEVALCYFRAGYQPKDYCNEESWKGRLLIERSTVPKCPTIAEQLVGTKKIQQVFAQPGMVERFIKDEESVQRIRRTFAGLYTLDPGEEGDRAAAMAIESPSRYVLKPQREGGGNNMYDDEMVAELKRISDPVERSQYILMERVVPPIIKNYIVHVEFEKPLLADTVAELGVFGVFLSDGSKEIFNDAVGPLLRTKDIQHKDGGVAAGRAVLDSPYLI